MKINLESTDHFVNRHIGPGPRDLEEMLQTVGVSSLDELIDQTIPGSIRLEKDLDLPEGLSEHRFLTELRKTAGENQVFRSYIGLGYYNTLTPGVIQRNILENPGWYTQYTPYQAEISQGRLEALLNFQTMVMDLTALDIANASLLDEGTAAAEAMTLFHRLRPPKKNKADTFFVSNECLPQTIAILKSRAEPLEIKLVVGDFATHEFTDEYFGALLQYPTADGQVHDYRAFIEKAHATQARVAMAADLLSLTLLTPPGELGADVALGNTQRLGVPMGFGGPHAAYFATSDELKRQLPGRIIGVSIDSRGKRAYRMALQTREQHIRREKATSNICTAQALLAIMAGMYAVYHGPEGLRNIALRVHTLTKILESELKKLGYEQANSVYFDTLKIKGANVDAVREEALSRGINLRYEDDFIGISLDESVGTDDLRDLVDIFARTAGKSVNIDPEAAQDEIDLSLPAGLKRGGEVLSHPIFSLHHSETAMMRYIKTLENRDLALNTAMIPLGSCTMKLNAVAEMAAVTWPEFSVQHPFAPSNQTAGYQRVIGDLEKYLCEITGFAACSLQPNSGAQGEYSGLMVIRQYHLERGDTERNIALIPASAHGTNPASAVMAGMKVVVVACDDQGNIDLEDLQNKAAKHADNLSSLMVTYPSTHGVFEEEIKEICDTVHKYGGLVYMDGANMNAQVGLTSPANIGADVCHLNLHKTFSIPHGGGGPGMGPICVTKDLAPYLPGHPLRGDVGGDKAIHAVSAAPWGSASILLISYAYIKLLGREGATAATKYAMLNANYIKARLEKDYNVLYTGKNGRVAHEMIIDFRHWKKDGLEVEDVAKRLIDYGFHAPTMSFPIAGTLMVEPTESEPRVELDRFCDAMLAIRAEIQELLDGSVDAKDNVLKNAPHTSEQATADNWPHGYSREKAVYPVPSLRENKFWPPVGRVDNVHGDRNLICACPPMEAYEEADESADRATPALAAN